MSERKQSRVPEPGSEFLAVRFAMAALERSISHRLLHTRPEKRPDVLKCILEATYSWHEAVKACHGKGGGFGGGDKDDKGGTGGGGGTGGTGGGGGGGPKGPTCQKGWIAFGDICIPDPDAGG